MKANTGTNKVQTLFLEALGAYLKNEKLPWEEALSAQTWEKLFSMGKEHHVLPMIYGAVYDCPAAKAAEGSVLASARSAVLRQVMVQTIKTHDFLELYRHLQQRGVEPILVKGLLCRELYHKPDERYSGDEDLLIRPEDFALCHRAMLDYGMVVSPEDTDLDAAHEVTYCKPGSYLHIELHKQLFPPDSEAYGELNGYFSHVFREAIRLNIQGTDVAAMPHTDHFFYLLCHALKHFLHSGFGIRQVCDIVLYANSYGAQLDWQRLYEQSAAIGAEYFAAALLRIGEKYLTFSPEKAACPALWRELEVDEGAMLEDLLGSGIYGQTTMSRKHSSNMTLDAVAAQKKGGRAKTSLRSSLFPGAKKLSGRYPYLKKHPVLLPVAWGSRLIQYGKETLRSQDNNAADAVKIGKDRVELLRTYHIIE